MSTMYIDDTVHIKYPNCSSLSELASEIKNNADIDDVIYIYLPLKFNDCKRIEYIGIEFLIWLRLKGVMNHCILYSFELLNSILEGEPRRLVLISKGTSYYQLPIEWSKIDISRIKFNKADNEDLKKLLKLFYEVNEYRHRDANRFGVKCLWDVHKIIDSDFIDKYPESINDDKHAIDSALIRFLYFKSKYSENYPNLDTLQRIRRNISDLRAINPLPNVIFIDDQANIGWAKMFSKILYGDSNQRLLDSYFNVIVPNKTNTVNDIFNIFSRIVRQSDSYIDLVIIDLRLFDEVGIRKDINRVSGVDLFINIKKRYRAIPVLIITASNKINIYSYLHEQNYIDSPNGFWIKEGIDYHNYENDKLYNYLSLVSQLSYILKQRRKNRFVKSFMLNSCTNVENRNKELNIVNNGFPEVNNKVSNVTFDSMLEKMYSQKYCLIDTNIFIKSSLCDLFDYSQSIILLSELRARMSFGKIGVHINVFAEILKYGMAGNDDIINMVARKSHKNLQLLYSKDQLEIIIPKAYHNSPEKLEKVITGIDPYADDALFNKCKGLLESEKSILFISDDKKSDGTAKQLEKYLINKTEMQGLCKIINGKDMVLSFSKILNEMQLLDNKVSI